MRLSLPWFVEKVATKTYRNLNWGGMRKNYLSAQQANFISRTVMVEKNEVEPAMKLLNGIMANEGMLKRWKLNRRYEKPTWARNRVNYERCKAIYDEDMRNRVNLIMRKYRTDPYPGTK